MSGLVRKYIDGLWQTVVDTGGSLPDSWTVDNAGEVNVAISATDYLDAILTVINEEDTYEFVAFDVGHDDNAVTDQYEWQAKRDVIVHTKTLGGDRQGHVDLLERQTSDGKVTGYASFSPQGFYATEVDPTDGSSLTSLTVTAHHGLSVFGGQDPFRVYSAAFALLFQVEATGTLLFIEQADPAAPAANQARLYSRDNGSGKTQIVARFSSGAVQVMATQP